jgi:DNA-binding response OmpR family regulator
MVLGINQPTPETPRRPAAPARRASAPSRVLVATKEEGLRNFDSAICAARGFEVIQARWGDEALQLFRDRRPITLVITDLLYDWSDWRLTMRGDGKTIKNGIQLAVAIRKLHAKQRIIVQTYSAIAPVREHLTGSIADIILLHKPYRSEDLAALLDDLKLHAPR